MTSNHVKAVANDIGEDAAASAKRTASAARDAASDASGSAHEFTDQAAQKANDLYRQTRDRLSDAADGLPDRAADAIAAGQRVYSQSQKTIGRQVAKQPIEALLLAGAIGYLVGWASNRS